MGTLARVPLLARMAVRYAKRHRGQTIRAVFGLIVVALVLTTGLGLGDSVGHSLEAAVRAQYGPVDVVVRGFQPFDASFAEQLPRVGPVVPYGLEGGATLVTVGSVSNPVRHRAEAFASIRGVSATEPQRLGPLPPGDTPEPRPGEVVISRSLADRLEAVVGDELLLRSASPGATTRLTLSFTNHSAAAGPVVGPSTFPFHVNETALGFLARVEWLPGPATVNVTITSPGGRQFFNQSAQGPILRLVNATDAPLEPGDWTVRIDADLPVRYQATVVVGEPSANLTTGVATLRARLVAITPSEGRAAISSRPVALVPLSDLQSALDLEGRATHGYYRVAGDPHAAVAVLREQLSNHSYEVRAVKAEAVTRAREAGANVTGFLLVMGGFTMTASVLLAYALFSALVEERRTELGIARALGLTRGEIAATMTGEGLLYAVAASTVGVLTGIGLLKGLLFLIDSISQERGGPAFDYHLDPTTLPTAFLGGILLPLLTIGLSSLRFARLDPARAIRGAPDDLRVARRFAVVASLSVALVGSLLTLWPLGRLIGFGILGAGLGLLLATFGRRLIAVLLALLGLAYTAWTLYDFNDFPPTRRQLDPVFTMLRGLVLALVACAALFASPAPFRFLARFLGKAKRVGRAAFVAFRYVAARRRPAGLTAAMIAVVAVVVTVMGTLTLLFTNTIAKDEAGYEVIGQSALPLSDFPRALPASAQHAVERADFLPTHREFRSVNATLDGTRLPRQFRSYLGATEAFAAANEYVLIERADAYASDRDAWAAVARGEALIAPSFYFGPGELDIGATLAIHPALGPAHTYVVAGSVRGGRGALIVASEHVRDMGYPQGSLVFVRVRDGADDRALAHELTEHYAPDGIAFESVPEEAEAAAATTQAAVLVFESFLALGVLVGIAATGFLATRAVHERIREIGTLRALGYEAPDVRRAFVLESTFVTLLGLLVGTAIGILVAHSIWWRNIRGQGVAFVLPWTLMAGFAATVLLLAALAARGPARRAARQDPAAALRYVE